MLSSNLRLDSNPSKHFKSQSIQVKLSKRYIIKITTEAAAPKGPWIGQRIKALLKLINPDCHLADKNLPSQGIHTSYQLWKIPPNPSKSVAWQGATKAHRRNKNNGEGALTNKSL